MIKTGSTSNRPTDSSPFFVPNSTICHSTSKAGIEANAPFIANSVSAMIDVDEVRMIYTYINPYMPEKYRVFHTSNIPFLPVTILGESGRPWGSIFAGKEGKTRFVRSSGS